MADHPILFSAPMVRAMLDGTKTQTRRILKPQPPCMVGDRLWVRESWWIATMYSYGTTPGGCEIDPPPLAHRKRDPVHYNADGKPPNVGNRTYGPDGLRGGSFAAPDPYAVWHRKPSIHMPRWASRLTLTVTDVRVERLQNISEADAKAEGVSDEFTDYELYGQSQPYRFGYSSLWNLINGESAWDANPWVVAYTFRPILGNIDKIGGADG